MQSIRSAVAAVVVAGLVGVGAGVESASATEIVVHSSTGFAGTSFDHVETDDFSVAFNDAGDFLFFGYTNDPYENYLFKGNLYNPAAAQKIAQDGQVYGGYVINNLDQDGVNLNAAGDFTFSASIGGFAEDYYDGFFKNAAPIVKPGDTIDGYAIQRADDEGSDLNDLGQFFHVAKVSDGRDGVFFNGKKVVLEGESIGGETFLRLRQNTELRVNNNGVMAFTGVTYDDPDWDDAIEIPSEHALFRSSFSGNVLNTETVAKSGDVIAGHGTLIRIHEAYLDLNDHGHVAFGATLANESALERSVIMFDDGTGPTVRFAAGQVMPDGRVLERVDSTDGLLINDAGDIVFLGAYDDGSEYGRRALFNQDGLLLETTAYDNLGNIVDYGTQIGDYYVSYISGEAWALNEQGQLLVAVGLMDASGNATSALVLVPEPTSALLATPALAGLLLRRRR